MKKHIVILILAIGVGLLLLAGEVWYFQMHIASWNFFVVSIFVDLLDIAWVMFEANEVDFLKRARTGQLYEKVNLFSHRSYRD